MVTPNNVSCRSRPQRIIPNIYLVWLDENINENNHDCRRSITQLRQVVNIINTFVNIDECIDFITDRPDQAVFMVTSRTCTQQLLTIAADISQLKSIYIFCQNGTSSTTWTNECSKINDGFTDVLSICEALKQTLKDYDHNEVSISFAKPADRPSNANERTLDCSFMYTQILKEILLTIDFNNEHFRDFLTFCRAELVANTRELQNVDRIQNEYYNRKPIWWYTYQSFLYSMVNRALRLMDIDIIVKMGFFVCDLHKHIALLHAEQFSRHTSFDSFIVYRGQGLSQLDFDQMKENRNGLLAFNNFLSTSKNRQVSLRFIRRIVANGDLVPMLFVMHIDPSIKRTPFANVVDVSAIKREEEILFSMHSVFRIGQMKNLDDDNRIWEVELIFTSENDPELHALTEKVREEIEAPAGWHRLGEFMIQLAKYDKAEELYLLLLREANDQNEKAYLFHQLGQIYYRQARYEEAVKYNQKSLEIKKKSLLVKHSSLAASFNNMGSVYDDMGEYSKALEYHQKSIEILKKSLPVDHPNLAASYNNIGNVYKNMGEHSKALEYFQKSLEIKKKRLPDNHPDLATSYNNIGFVYASRCEYSKALEYHQKDLEIMKKSLPVDHPSLATSYNNIGNVYKDMGEYSKALEYYRKSLDIRKKSLPVDHPDLANSYNNVGLVCNSMGEYSKALEYHQKVLEISKKNLAVDHPSLATSYNNIGSVYNGMGQYSKALEYHQKSLEITQKSLSVNYPSLATSYNNIGSVYNTMEQYSKALEYFEKALEVWKKSLPVDHPTLATSYKNIGNVYHDMNEYSKALKCYEKALEIKKKSLAVDHPSLATSYNNIGNAYSDMGEYSKALEYYRKSLDIREKNLPVDHPDLANSYNNIGTVCYYKQDYKRALEYLERALNIREKSLPANHPRIKNIKLSIEKVKKKL